MDEHHIQHSIYLCPSPHVTCARRYPYYAGLAHLVICNGFAENLPLDMPILPHVLHQTSYATHAVGKWDVRVISPTSRANT